MAASTAAGDRLRVKGSISAKTGLPPQYAAQFALARKVMGEVITSSPGPTPKAAMSRCSAAVPLQQATACRAPTRSPRRASNSAVRGPCVRNADVSASTTASTSSSDTVCLP